MPRQKSFASLTVDQLLKLRNDLDSYLSDKRQQLMENLGALERFTGVNKRGAPGRSVRRTHPSKGKKVRPKYRNPEDPSQTWAGRGAQPRWLRVQLEAGKSLEQFAVAASGTSGKTRRGRPRKSS